MTEELKELIKKARAIKMSEKEKEEQRRSFAYGNTHIENSDITRETVRDQAEALKKA